MHSDTILVWRIPLAEVFKSLFGYISGWILLFRQRLRDQQFATTFRGDSGWVNVATAKSHVRQCGSPQFEIVEFLYLRKLWHWRYEHQQISHSQSFGIFWEHPLPTPICHIWEIRWWSSVIILVRFKVLGQPTVQLSTVILTIISKRRI